MNHIKKRAFSVSQIKRTALCMAIASACSLFPAIGHSLTLDSATETDGALTLTYSGAIDVTNNLNLYNSDGTVYGTQDAYTDVTALTVYLESVTDGIDYDTSSSYLHPVAVTGTALEMSGGINVYVEGTSSLDNLLALWSNNSTGVSISSGDIYISAGAETSVATRIVGAYNSSGIMSTGGITIEETGRTSSYALGGTYGAILATSEGYSGDAISITIAGVEDADTRATTGTVYGFQVFNGGAGEVSLGSITVSISDIDPTTNPDPATVSTQTNIVGYGTYSQNNVDVIGPTATVGSITVELTNAGSSSQNFWLVRAVNQPLNETLTVNGDVSLTLTNSSAELIEAVAVQDGSATIKGNVNLTLYDVYDSAGTQNSTAGIWVGHGLDAGGEFEAPGTYQYSDTVSATVNGAVNVNFTIGTADDTFTQDIFGAAVTFDTRSATLTIGQGVNVTVAGDMGDVDFLDHTIYGAVNGSGSEGSGYTIGEGYKRVLTLGSTASDGTVTVFTSTADDTSIFSFSNFDTVTVGEGSSLYLSSSTQNPHLYGDKDITNVTEVTDENGEGTGVYSAVENYTNGLIDGISSYAGRLYLSAASDGYSDSDGVSNITLTTATSEDDMYGDHTMVHPASELIINSGSDVENYVMQLQNNGTVTLNNSSSLTLTDTEMTVSGQSAQPSYNYGTITGDTGILNFVVGSSDSGNTEVTTTSGTFFNTGTINVLTINFNGATADNSGTVSSTTLNFADGTLTNSGTVRSTILNFDDGTLTNTDSLHATILTQTGGTIATTGAGALASFTTAIISAGTLSNASSGITALGYLTLSNDGEISNSSYMVAYSQKQSGGTVTNSDTYLAATMELSDSASVTQTAGNMVAPTFSLSGDAEIDISGGQFVAPSTLAIGTLSLTVDGENVLGNLPDNIDISSIEANGATFGAEGTMKITGDAQALVATSSTINSSIYVGDSGKLGIGDVTATLNLDLAADSTTGEVTGNGFTVTYDDNSPFNMALENFSSYFTSIPSGSLTLTAAVTTGDTGYIQVGGTYEDPVGLNFAEGSTLILTSAVYNDSSAIAFTNVGTGTGEDAATISVASDSKLYVAVNGIGDEYYVIAKNYAYTEGSDTDPANWNDGNFTVVNGLGDDVTANYEVQDVSQGATQYVILYQTSEPTVDVCEQGYVACNNINTDILDPDQPGPGIVEDIVLNDDIPPEQKRDIMNSIANLPFAGGVIGVAMNGLMGDITDLNNHLTMDSDTFGAHGVMWPYDEWNNMWLDVHGTWYNQKHLKASGIDRAGWRAQAFGFILGYDRKLKDRPVAIGAAFSFTGGNVKSTGNISYTKNKYQEYGLHLWSNYSPNEHLNVIGALHWMHNVADVTQNVGVTGYKTGTYYANAHGHMNTDWLAVGVRFETSFSAGAFTFIPHVEPRYVYAKMRDFDTQVNGTTIWKTHAKGNSFFQIPVGIAARADYSTDNGWIVRPNLDITLTPQVGSTKLKTTLSNVYNAADVIEGEFMGRFQAAAKLGVQFERKNWTFGAKYGVVGGDRGRIDHGFILQTRLRF